MVGQDIDMIPLVGTHADLPEWTSRRDRMRDSRQRLMGCFEAEYELPGCPEGTPAYDSREMQAMEAYMQWAERRRASEGPALLDTPEQARG